MPQWPHNLHQNSETYQPYHIISCFPSQSTNVIHQSHMTEVFLKITKVHLPAASGNVMATTWALATSRTSTTENETLGIIGSFPDISLLMASILVPPCWVRTGPRIKDGFITASSNFLSSRWVRYRNSYLQLQSNRLGQSRSLIGPCSHCYFILKKIIKNCAVLFSFLWRNFNAVAEYQWWMSEVWSCKIR